MLWKLFKPSSEYVDIKEYGVRNPKRYFVVVLIVFIAVCFLIFGNNDNPKNNKDVGDKKVSVQSPEQSFEEYILSTENRLKSVLAEIKDAGRVQVMLSFSEMNEQVLAKNKKRDENTSDDTGKVSKSTGYEENVMVYGSGTEEQPYILKEKLPVPDGVLVLATGADKESVRLEIYEAVKALYGISGHRIKVARLK